MQVEIDPHSGFCGGVIRAIGEAERVLDAEGRLYSLGAIVHNEEELARLQERGLVTLETDDLRQIGTQVELSNTYHLHVRPGNEKMSGDQMIRELGGIRRRTDTCRSNPYIP